jgi:hypothetical protein
MHSDKLLYRRGDIELTLTERLTELAAALIFVMVLVYLL